MSVIEEQRDRIVIVTLDREAKRNAIDGAVTLGIDAALNRFDDDAQLAVAIITGGPSTFSAGTRTQSRADELL